MSDDRPEGSADDAPQPPEADDRGGHARGAEDRPGGGCADGMDRDRTRRRADALGDLVPEGTGERRGGSGDRDRVFDEDYLRDVPPHHG